MILILFFCSGATALVYEVLWSKHLSLIFGSTVQAQTVVLAVFMGGLALGNRLAAHWADRARSPLKAYGYLEIAIALYGCFFSTWYAIAEWLFVGLGSRLLEHPFWLLSWKAVLSAGLLLLPTVLMGATLPCLAVWLERTQPDAGRRTARFYATNCLGAVAGAGLAGFYLVQALGMEASLQITALVNGLVGVVAVLLGSQSRLRLEVSPSASHEGGGDSWHSLGTSCLLVALSGGISMGMEVLASRALSLITGASLQAFALVLIGFILGISLGSSVAASPRVRNLCPITGTALLFLISGVWIGGLALAIESWVEFYYLARSGLASNDIGYLYHQLLVGGMAVVVLGVPSGLLGANLPFWMRVVSTDAFHLGGRIGRLLTWNTMGAVVGTLITGFVIMPQMGLRGAFGLMTLLLSLTAAGIAWRGGRIKLAILAGIFLVLLGVGFLVGGEGWRYTVTSGVFRLRAETYTPQYLAMRKQAFKILFYEDAPDATVALEERVGGSAGGRSLSLCVNGKTDASTSTDLSTQYLLAHVPMALRPESREVFVLGFGSGITAGALLGYPEVRITVAENCAPVLRAASFFAPWNRDVLHNERVKVWREDARTVLKLSPQQYDLILSEPSNPWTAGIGSVFSEEFFKLAASRLKENGLMAQWFHTYEMNDGIVAMVMRTFQGVFRHCEIWDTAAGDLILVGARQPWTLDLERMRQIFALEEPAKDLRRIGVASAEFLLARQLASQRTASSIAGDGPIQSDAFPILEYAAPRAFFIGRGATLLQQYDERTLQSALAPKEKRQVLAQLGPANLKAIFGEFRGVNPQLEQYINWYADAFPEGTQPTAPLNQNSLPSIFRPPQVPFQMSLPPVNAPLLHLELWEAERLIHEVPERTPEALQKIQSVLQSLASGTLPKNMEGLPARYAGLAARACFREDHFSQANEFVTLGLKLQPTDPVLNYYQRVLNRLLSPTQPK
jgi:predicted membrane-bound spermidine synthase